MKVSKEQESILAILAGLLLLAWFKHSLILFIISCLVAVTFPFPVLNKPVYKFWMLLSTVLGWISSHIILSLLFYLFLTPIALLRRLAGRESLSFSKKKQGTSFYRRDHVYNSNDFTNPW